MPLSEHEQRILDEIERRLAAEDPKFARSATLATPRGHAIKRIKRASFLFLVGLGLLLGGLLAGLSNTVYLFGFGLGGFAVMLFAVIVIAKSSRSLGKPSSGGKDATWFTRAEERWRKRFENGDAT